MENQKSTFSEWIHIQVSTAKIGLSSACSLSSILGINYTKGFSFRHIFSSFKIITVNVLAFLFLTILFIFLINFIFLFFQWSTKNLYKTQTNTILLKIKRLLLKGNFLVYFIIIIICWLPFIVISYPGGTCVDVNYQILQGLGEFAYSTWQPLFHTLLLEGFIKTGALLLKSYNLGLFLYIIFQIVLLATILSHSIQLLVRRQTKPQVIAIVLAVYCLVPIYPNFATMAIKDTLFAGFFLLYAMYFLEFCETLLEKAPISKKTLFYIFFAGLSMSLMRNNGIYSIVISLIVILVVCIKNRLHFLKNIFVYLLILISYLLIINTLKTTLHAEDLGTREILSIPMQQTARYCVEYSDEISNEEWNILGNVFQDPYALKELYDPNISDPVKSTFIASATHSDLLAYFGLYCKEFTKHPLVYVDAFLNHSYGWFYLGADNAIRYEGKLPIFSNTMLSVNSDYTVSVVYNILQKFPPYFILQNIGFYIWILFALMKYQKQKGEKHLFLFFSPLLVSILICIAAPAFYSNARYALPIVFSFPYYYGYFMTKGKN